MAVVAFASPCPPELYQVRGRLVGADARILLTAKHDHRVDSRGASSGQVGGEQRDADEDGDRRQRRQRISGSHIEELTTDVSVSQRRTQGSEYDSRDDERKGLADDHPGY